MTGIVNSEDSINLVDAESLLENFSANSDLPISGVVAKVHLRADAVPKFYNARTVPLHYKGLVEKALDDLMNRGIIESISFSDWAAPIVPVLKADKMSMRICCDFKYLNQNIACEKYPLPKVDEIMAVVGKSKIFSKVDLKDAYLQVPVDEESQNLLVINNVDEDRRSCCFFE